MKQQESGYKVGNILKSLGLIIFVMIVNTPPMIMVMQQDKLSTMHIWLGCGVWFLVACGVIAFLWHHYHASFFVQSPRLSGRDFLIDFGWAVLAFVLAVAGTLLLQKLTGQASSANDQAIQQIALKLKDAPLPLVASFILGIGVMAPIVEELVFRGLINHQLFNKNQTIWAGIVTSALFAVLHITNLYEFLLYLPMGLILFASYHRQGNIKDSMVVHLINNIRACLAILFMLMS
ncbi:CPBP family intramembrane glutamic endopeptidase [Vaginisenegalia massiliensis]|uniref:CPBP family intramembrane glutamic endopeptidase n=1 Tax=Vaginisenegalia massiliensis TaxID=2058294 RepID=UPI000F54B905|nr:CPBP family intramembrane glutamic endopeptidase [Vaginisenegalia massiliensis]